MMEQSLNSPPPLPITDDRPATRAILMYWLISLSLLIPSVAYAEVAACNADGVKDVFIKGQYNKIQNATGNLLDGASPAGSPAASLKSELSRWDTKIQNIRQTGYDSANNIRYCAAELLHTNYPEMTIMTLQVTGQLKQEPCRRSVVYKIEFLLDNNTDWITWGCQN